MLWLYNLPTWLFALMTVAVFITIALTGLLFSYHRMHRSALKVLIDNGTVGWFFSGVTVLYGLLLGLITVATWGNFTQADSIASQESAAIAVINRDLAGYGQPEQNELRGLLRQYTKSVIEKSWPAQRRGAIHVEEADWLTKFQNALLLTEPETEGQKIVYAETIRAFNNLVEQRRMRINSITGSIPGVLWGVVLVGALITIFFSYCFVISNLKLHALLTGLLAGTIGLLIFLIAALDHPYWGEVSVSADAYQLVLDRMLDVTKFN